MNKMIIYENIPCWYEFSWQEKEPAIILRIHQNFIANLNVNLQNSPFVKSLLEDFKFKDFSGDFNGDIGFNQAFKHKGEKDGFVEFLVSVPKVKEETAKKCPHCKGSGKEKPYPGKCIHCGGTGKEYITDWSLATAVSASFTIFTALLRLSEKDTSAVLPQLFTFKTITHKDIHGGSLSGDISISLCKWLGSFSEGEEISEMVQAMKIAYGYMFGGLKSFDEPSFRAYIRKGGRFTADCPGDACGLHPSDWYIHEGKGYEFSCHNVDTPMQQITLLAGLAALHDKARKEMKIY